VGRRAGPAARRAAVISSRRPRH